MSTITFYNNNSDENVLDKVITSLGSATDVIFKQECSMVNPIAILSSGSVSGSLLSANYAYVDTFSRYYYIRDFEVMPGGRIAVHLQVDPLKSFATEIKALQGIVCATENESIKNMDINDGSFVNQEGRSIEIKTWVTNHFLDTPTHILVVGG